jgi:N-acetyl-D-muramate 6-phosphate phosphatase
MPLDVARIRGICFDVDGTLSDTDDQWTERLERMLQPLKFVFPNQRAHDFSRRLIIGIESPGNFAYQLLDRLRLDDEAMRAFHWLQHLRNHAHRPGHFLLIPHVDEALHFFHLHYSMAVVSARGENGTLAFLEQYHLLPFFKTVVTSQTCAYTKPYPDPILFAAQQMGIRPEECLMVGDTTVDIRAGKAAGAQTCGVLCGFGTEKELRQAKADLILPSPIHLMEILFATHENGQNG